MDETSFKEQVDCTVALALRGSLGAALARRRRVLSLVGRAMYAILALKVRTQQFAPPSYRTVVSTSAAPAAAAAATTQRKK